MEDFTYPKNDREWRATTGMDERRFLLLLEIFEAAYVLVHGRRIEYRVADSPEKLTFITYKSLLFFTLFSLKSGLTYDPLGFVSTWMCRMPSVISRWAWRFCKRL